MTKSEWYDIMDVQTEIALISAGITVITSALGFSKVGQLIIESSPMLFLSIGIGLSLSLAGVCYDFADFLYSNRIKFKSSI